MNSPAKSARRLKMAGLMLMVVCVVGFAVLREAVGDDSKLLTGTPRYIALIAGARMVLAHVFALGLIVLLAGLKDVPLLTSASARRGARQKLFGSTLIILGWTPMVLMDMPAFQFVDDVDETWWILLPSLAALLVSARIGSQVLRSGWKYDVVSAEQLLARDPRPPVVYLRSFEADSEIILRPEGFWQKAASACFDYMARFSPEQELVEILNRVGPVIAIGKPGEPLPELGAARLYVGDADWKAKVIDMITRSRLVIIRTGATPGLQWEIEQTMARVPRRQILFVSLGDAKKTAPFDQYFEKRFGPVMPSSTAADTPVLTKLLISAGPIGKAKGKIISFDDALQARAEPIRPTLSWTGWVGVMMHPYRDSIQLAMQHVFASLDLPWVVRRSQTAAVLLAMFGGIVGMHHFYLGNRRRWFMYLAFFWTGVPMFAGWYDAVKYAQLEPREFDEKYGAP